MEDKNSPVNGPNPSNKAAAEEPLSKPNEEGFGVKTSEARVNHSSDSWPDDVKDQQDNVQW